MSKKSRERREQHRNRVLRESTPIYSHYEIAMDVALIYRRMVIEMLQSPRMRLFEHELIFRRRLAKVLQPTPRKIEPLRQKVKRVADDKRIDKEILRERREKAAKEHETAELRAKELRLKREPIPEDNYRGARRVDNPGMFEAFRSDRSVIKQISDFGYIPAFQVA